MAGSFSGSEMEHIGIGMARRSAMRQSRDFRLSKSSHPKRMYGIVAMPHISHPRDGKSGGLPTLGNF